MIYALLNGQEIVGFNNSDEELEASEDYILWPDDLAQDASAYIVKNGKVATKLVAESLVPAPSFMPVQTDLYEERFIRIEKRLAALEKKSGAKQQSV